MSDADFARDTHHHAVAALFLGIAEIDVLMVHPALQNPRAAGPAGALRAGGRGLNAILGQKQRIGLARALAAEPRLIICDEDTSALDQLVAEGILRLLDKVQRDFGLAYIFITHDLATVKSIADQVSCCSSAASSKAAPRQTCSPRRITPAPICC